MDLPATRAHYEAVKDALKDSDREHIEELRREREAGGEGKYNYGHDLSAAVARGHSRKADNSAAELLRQVGLSVGYGERSGKYRMEFSLALHTLIEAAAKNGVTAEEIRRVLTIRVDSTDSMSLEKIVDNAKDESAED